MKKYIYLIVLALILGLVLTGCSLLSNISQVPATNQSGITYLTKGGPTEAEAESFPLYAGQDWLVGEVLVWDDGMKVCVKYVLDPAIFADGWGLTETHLAVGAALEDIPTNKSGNPQVGKFPHGYDKLGGVAEDGPYCIDFGDGEGELEVECSDTLFIAAHAVIEKCVTVQDTLVPALTWTRSSELDVEVFPGYGAQWNQVEGFAILTPDALVWDGGTLGQYFTGYSIRDYISWASWICTENPTGKSLTGTDLRRFNAAFEIPAGYNVTGATLGSVNSGYENVIPMNDNIYIFMNEELIFWGGTIGVVAPGTTHFLLMERRDTETKSTDEKFKETDGWYMDGTFPAVPSGLFIEGQNKLDVFAEEFWTGGGMHELGLTLQVEQTTCETESAWAANKEIEPEDEEGTIQFVDSKSWATYFNYTVQHKLGCPGIDSLSGNIQVLDPPPANVQVGSLENDDLVRVWKEFEGPLPVDLYYDLDEGDVAKDGIPGDQPKMIPSGREVCIFYVHFDNEGETSSLEQIGWITFGAEILGLIISGGDIGDFEDEDLMFDADHSIGNPGTIYPDTSGNNYKRGFDVNWYANTDDAVFNDATVDFTMFVVEAHDSFRVILPMVPVPCEE